MRPGKCYSKAIVPPFVLQKFSGFRKKFVLKKNWPILFFLLKWYIPAWVNTFLHAPTRKAFAACIWFIFCRSFFENEILTGKARWKKSNLLQLCALLRNARIVHHLKGLKHVHFLSFSIP